MTGSLRLALPVVALGLAACTAQDRAPAAPIPTADAASSQCINLRQVVSRRAVLPNALEFELVGGRTVRSTLLSECPRLDQLDRFYTIEFDNRNGRRVCRGDRFRLVDLQVARAGGTASFPWCRFGEFRTVPPTR